MNARQIDLLAEHQAEERQRRAQFAEAKTALLRALKKSHIAHVAIEYDGESDSGQVSDINMRTAQGKPAKLPKAPFAMKVGNVQSSHVSFEDALDHFAWSVLQAYHDGFENGEGGYGTIDIDVRKGTVTINHNDRVVEVCNSLTEV